jgi:two-component system, sensor histidine kinase and response regulator
MMNNPTDNSNKAHILIVDDIPENMIGAERVLKRHGYIVSIAGSGQHALEQIQNNNFDLVLLDIMMPMMDGFEVCRIMKQEPQNANIPVIFLTAVSDLQSVVKGFECGGVDYITKPFNVNELLARVNTHVQLRRLQRLMIEQNQLLQHQNQRLEQQYKELHTLAHSMTVDLKQPVNAMAGFIKILNKDMKSANNPQALQFLSQLENTRNKVANTLDHLLLLANIRTHELKPQQLEMATVVKDVLERLNPLIEEKKAIIKQPNLWSHAWGDEAWVMQIWHIYLNNALRHGGNPPRIELGAENSDHGLIKFWVRDNARALSADEQARLGDGRLDLVMGDNGPQFSRALEGYGLELSVVQRLAERLGGYTGLESLPGQGNIFYFTLPTDNCFIH